MPQESQKVAVSTFPVGMKIDDRYEVLGILGSGGFATVYKARHLMIDRDVALKVMDLQKGVDPSYEERFFREAKIAAKIHHNNVVTIYDFGFVSQTGQPYIAMELLEGHDLGDEITKNGPLSPNRAFILFRPVLEALGEGHRLGIVHKDLKPANLYLTDPGGLREMMKVLDFGVARMDSGEVSKLTSAGQLLGTPRYLAPEYIKSQLVTPAIDVYQMALIISEALTGQVAVEGAPYTAMMLHCTGKIQIADFLKQGRVGEVFSKALSIDPNERYQNADDFAEALDTISDLFESNIPLQGGAPQRSPELSSQSSKGLKSRVPSGVSSIAGRSTGRISSPIDFDGTEEFFDEEPVAKKKKSGLIVTLLIVFILAAAGIGGYLYLNKEENLASAPQAEETVAPSTFTFRFETKPSGATIQTKTGLGFICQQTPCEYTFLQKDLPQDLTISLDGYEGEEIAVNEQRHLSDKGQISIDLKEIPKAVDPPLSFNLVLVPNNSIVKEEESGLVVCESSGCKYELNVAEKPSVKLLISAAGYESTTIELNRDLHLKNPLVNVELTKKPTVARRPSTQRPAARDTSKPPTQAAVSPPSRPSSPAEAPEPRYGSAEFCKKYPDREACIPGSTEFCRLNPKHARCAIAF